MRKYLLGLVILAAFDVRIFNLGENSLWFDEAIYFKTSLEDPFWGSLRRSNSSPPFLPLLYSASGTLLQDSFWARFPPMIFGVGAVAVVATLSLPAGLLMALSPTQIQYSQEVREYSLSVLVSALIILSLSNLLKAPSGRNLIFFSIALIFAPFTAYGACLMASSALIALAILDKRRILYPAIAFVSSLAVAYFSVAQYQMRITKSWHLSSYYPDLTNLFNWSIQSFGSYVSFPFGFDNFYILLICILALFFSVSLKSNRENFLSVLFLILFTLSFVLSLVNIYPLGGIRQHLFSSPLIFLLVCKHFDKLLIKVVFSVILASSISKLPSAYGEFEDVISPINNHLADVKDADVYIYYGAEPAVSFHYPYREFHRGLRKRGDIKTLADEISSFSESKIIHVLFSHVVSNEDNMIVSELLDKGLTIINDYQFTGSRLITFETPR